MSGSPRTSETLPSPSQRPAGDPAYQLQVDPQLCPELVRTNRVPTMVSPSEGNEARRNGRQGVAASRRSIKTPSVWASLRQPLMDHLESVAVWPRLSPHGFIFDSRRKGGCLVSPIASEIAAHRKQSHVDRHPPLAAIVPMPRPVVRSTSTETGNSQQSRVALGLSQPFILARGV